MLQAVQNQGLPVEHKRPDNFMAGCPVHADRTPSMNVTWRQGGRGGAVLLFCHGCGQPAAALVDGLGLTMADLFDEPLPAQERSSARVGRSSAQRRGGKRRGKLGRLPVPITHQPAAPDLSVEHAWTETARYPYHSVDGTLVQEVIREECSAEGAQHKQFRQLFIGPSGQRVKRRPEGMGPVLYRASQIREAVTAGREIFLLEGEKDCDNAVADGLEATTNAQGGRSFPDELIDDLIGASQVNIVLDRDATGWARGVDLHTKLTAAGIAVALLLPAVEDAKADYTDHREQGFTREDLIPVHVEEVATWHALAAVSAKKTKQLDRAVDEARSRWELAEAGQDVEDNRRFARRWTLETQIQHEALLELVDQVYAHAHRVGTEWAGEAVEQADALFAEATAAARRCHYDIGEPIPPALRRTESEQDEDQDSEQQEQHSHEGQEPSPEIASEAGGAVPQDDVPASGLSAVADPAQSPDSAESPRAAQPRKSRGGGASGSSRTAHQASSGDTGSSRSSSSRSSKNKGWASGSQGARASQPVFRVLDGQIVQWTPDDDVPHAEEITPDTPQDGKLKVLLSTVVEVVAREYLEVEEDHDVEKVELMGRSTPERQRASAPRALVAVRLRFPDPATSELLEVRVSADQWRDHSWLEALPGHPDYDHRRAGLDTLQRAILAISENVADEELFRSTGWRTNADGTHRYIHRRGAIDANGHTDIDVAFSGALQRYDLPDPTTDAQVLRKAWLETSATILDRLPERVSAPLLGQAFRAVLGHNEWVLTLVGPPGSYKTSVAAKLMQHFGEKWEHKKPASSMSGNGDTFNALRFKLHHAKDTLYWMDDFAPTKSWLEAQKNLEETARLVHNMEERGRSSRDGLSISDGTGPRASGLCTSEVMPRPGSGADRMLVVPLSRQDVDTALLFPLDEPESRHGRALLMASFISWLARDLTEIRSQLMKTADEYADQLAQSGETVRQGQAIAHTWIGWLAVTDFLLDIGAITEQERQAVLARVDEGLRTAGRAAHDPDMPRTTGARVRELLSFALRQGIAYVDDVRTGGVPPWPLASRLGWKSTVTEVNGDGTPARHRYDRGQIRLGHVLHDPTERERGRVLMCDSPQLEAVLKAASATQAEKLEIDRGTAVRALYEEGVLLADTSEGRIRYSLKCKIYCEGEQTLRKTTLWLDKIIGEELPEDDDSDDDPDGGSAFHPNDTGPTGGPGGSPGTNPLSDGPHDGGAGLDVVDENDDEGDDERWQGILSLEDSVEDAGGQADTAVADMPPAPVADLGDAGSDQVIASVLDTVPAVGQARQVVTTTDDAVNGPDQPSEETVMSRHVWTSSCNVDRDGVEGWSTQPPAGWPGEPCVICGKNCRFIIENIVIHVMCFIRSSAAERSGQTPPPAADNGTMQTVQVAQTASAAATPSAPIAQTTAPSAPAAVAPASSSTVPAVKRPTSRRSSGPGTQFRAAAAVVDVEAIWLSNGERLPLEGPAPAHVGDLLRLGRQLNLGTQITPYRNTAGQIWVTAALAAHMGINVDAIMEASEPKQEEVTREATHGIPAVTDALAQGVHLGGVGDRLGRWTRAWAGTDLGIWIVLIPSLPRDPKAFTLLIDDPEPAALARRLGLLADAIKTPFKMSSSTTGIDLMQDLRHKEIDTLYPEGHDPIDPAMINSVAVDITWSRKPTQEEIKHRWVHAYDRSGSYLAGLAGLELGIGTPVHHPEGTVFTPNTPGYWYLEIPEAEDWRMPNPLDPRGNQHGKRRWVTTPRLEFAHRHGFEPQVLEAYTWPEHSRLMNSWYEHMRDGRTSLDIDDPDAQIARDQVKLIYAASIGMMGSHSHMGEIRPEPGRAGRKARRGYDPARRHHIVDKAGINILHRVKLIGKATDRWPVAIVADTVLYTSDEPDPEKAWPGGPKWFGRNLGQYKAEGRALLQDHLPFLTGGPYRGKEELEDLTGGQAAGPGGGE